MLDPQQVFWTINKAGESFSSLPFSKDIQLLSPVERQTYAAMKIPKRQREWLLGRLTVKRLLTSPGFPLAGRKFEEISVENQPEGAPFVSSHPEIGAISISHREQIAACAFLDDPDSPIGIDLEWIEPRQPAFVEDFFTPNEAAYIQQLDLGPRRDEIVTLIWSAKEAILKVWQKGLRLDTRHIEITLPPHQDSPTSSPWQPLSWTTDLSGYRQCWVGWQRWDNFIITMAVAKKSEERDFPPPIVTKVIL